MRITTKTIDEFLEALTHEDEIFCNTIRISSGRIAVDAASREPVKFKVVIQASTIVKIGDQSEYLLEGGEFCGHDYEDASQDKAGTKAMQALKEKIQAFAATRNWKVLPGLIEI
jgi:hypothetical protein